MTEMRHGTWWDRIAKQMKKAPLSEIMEGRFTRLFPGVPAATFEQADLEKLAELMPAKQEDTPSPEIEVDPE